MQANDVQHGQLHRLRAGLSKADAEAYRAVAIVAIANGTIGPTVFNYPDGSTYVALLDQTSVQVVEENGRYL